MLTFLGVHQAERITITSRILKALAVMTTFNRRNLETHGMTIY